MISGVVPLSVRSSCEKQIVDVTGFLAANIGIGQPLAFARYNHVIRKPACVAVRLGSALSIEARNLIGGPSRVGDAGGNPGDALLLPVVARTRLKPVAVSHHGDDNSHQQGGNARDGEPLLHGQPSDPTAAGPPIMAFLSARFHLVCFVRPLVASKVRHLFPPVKPPASPHPAAFAQSARQPLPTHLVTRLFVLEADLSVPVPRPAVPVRVNGVPSRRPTVPVEAPAMPVTAPAIPVTCPSVPEARLCVPVTRPAGFCLKSVPLLDTCVQF